MQKKRFFLYSFFLIFLCCNSFLFAQEKSIIKVEQAQSTQTKKNEITDSDVILFSGEVYLTVEREDETSRIWADFIQYDRARQMLYAEGNVVVEQDSGGTGVETITATKLLFNVATLEGVFDDGSAVQSDKNLDESDSAGTTLIVASEIFARDDSGTVAFKDGYITFCDDPAPHWRIEASRIWLLPGNEFAFFNGLLYIGEIPVLYFPFFYYPKDELVFNPVFSARPREGYLVQTTTYIIGRKDPPEQEEGVLSFTQTQEKMKQELDGLFLRNTDEPLENETSDYLKLMLDYYTNLGIFTGIDGAFKPSAVVDSIDFKVNLGFSKNLYPASGSQIYVPNNPTTGKEEKNTSSLFNFDLPFRFHGDLNVSASGSIASLNVSLPLYSDPFFESDFLNRQESLNWISFLTEGSTEDEEELDLNTLRTSFTWKLSGSLKAPSSWLNTYVSTLKISSFESNIQFSSKTNTGLTSDPLKAQVDPQRTFYFPQILVPLKLSSEISGTLFSTSNTSVSSTQTDTPKNIVPPNDLNKEYLKENAQGSATDSTATETVDEPSNDKLEKIKDDLFPELDLPTPSVVTLGDVEYDFTYSIKPTFSSQNVYPSTNFSKPSDIDWSQFASTFVSIGGTADVESAFSWRDDFISVKNAFIFEPNFESHPYISEAYYNKDEKEEIIFNDYDAKKLDLLNTNTVSLSPFVLSEYFSETSIYWTTSAKMVRTNFIGTATDPEWEYLSPEWNEDTFTDHSLNLNLVSAQQNGDWKQSILLSADLPPLREAYSGKITFQFPYVVTSFSSGIERNLDQSDWYFLPFEQTLSVSLFDTALTLNQDFRYDIDEDYPLSFNTKAGYKGFDIAYTMLYTNTYILDEIDGWQIQSEKEFQPHTFSFNYDTENKTYYMWQDRVDIAPSLYSALVFDLIRPTNSYFVFEPAVTFRVNKYLDITFSAKSRNDSVFRYFQDVVDYSVEIPGERNVLIDLLNSFAFWDEQKRIESAFKLSSLDLKIEHDLHDWTLASELSIQPRLLTSANLKPYYDISPYFTLSVVWKPLDSMKTTVVDDYGEWKLNP